MKHIFTLITALLPLTVLQAADATKPNVLFIIADDLAARHPEIVKSLAARHDAWFSDVIVGWQQSRAHIVEQDRAYWKNRTAPDPVALFEDYWQWKAAPKGIDPKTADPLQVFSGFWKNDSTNQ